MSLDSEQDPLEALAALPTLAHPTVSPDGDFEYHELGEEGHASSDIDQKERMFRLLVDFLDRRVGGV